MLYRVSEFCNLVAAGINDFVDELTIKTGRHSESEKKAWLKALPAISTLLARPELNDFHLCMRQQGGLILEYRLPSASAWCDLVLLGNKDKNNPSVVIVEMKDWDTRGDESGTSESLIKHQGSYWLHPSDQVRGYSEYVSRFHSAVLNNNVNVAGCVYFTREADLTPYTAAPHTNLAIQYPLYSVNNDKSFSEYLSTHLKTPNEDFAKEFDRGVYKQDRNLLIQVAKNFKGESSPFVLLDEQRKGFNECISIIKDVLKNDIKKHVIVVEGPPGSGKSALAANLWADSVELVDKDKSIVFTTTSTSQNKNWAKLFKTAGKIAAARYIVKKTNDYNPGLNTSEWLSEKRAQGHTVEVETWRDNLQLYLSERNNRSPDDLFFMSIVDEAHALIDPSKEDARGISPSGWVIHAGPQGWHIIRCSQISVFFMDGEQSYRDNETTTKSDIIEYAKDFGADVHIVDLSDMQFRCAGSFEYTNWINSILFDSTEINDLRWRKNGKTSTGKFEFELVDNLSELEETLIEKIKDGSTVRYAASYAVPWKTKDVVASGGDPHLLPENEKDFYFEIEKEGDNLIWSKVWNYTPKQDYTYFIQAPHGSHVRENPLSEVGCPYVFRGFDYDYLGILWLDDLVWRKDKWEINLSNIYESAIKNSLSKAKKSYKYSPEYEKVLSRILRGYRILLTRALKGIYLWVKDEETKAHLTELLN